MNLSCLAIAGLLIFSSGGSARAVEDEGVSIPGDFVRSQAECHRFAESLIEPALKSAGRVTSVSDLLLRMQREPSELLSIFRDVAERRGKMGEEWRDVYFYALGDASSRMEDYPRNGCGPLFHELVAEKIYLALKDSSEPDGFPELAGVPAEKQMERKLTLLKLLMLGF